MDTGRAHSTFLEIAAAFIIRSRLGAARDPQARELMPFRWISSRRRRSALAPGSGGAFGCVFFFFFRERVSLASLRKLLIGCWYSLELLIG